MARKKSIYRQEAIDNIASPEHLNDYIEISNLSLKTIIFSIILFLIGTIIWSIFYKIDTIIKVGAFCQNRTCCCYVNESDFKKIKKLKNPQITINGVNYNLENQLPYPIKIDEQNYSYVMHISNLKPQDWAFKLTSQNLNIPNGVFEAYILIDRITPISFILN